MILIDIQKKDNNIYTLKYVDTRTLHIIKELDVKIGEDIFNNVDYKDFLIKTANKKLTVWNRDIALLLKDIDHASTHELATDEVFLIEDALVDLGKTRAYLNNFDKKAIDDFFKQVRSQCGNIHRMIKIYEIKDEKNIEEIYKYYDFNMLRDKFVKNIMNIDEADDFSLYEVTQQVDTFSKNVKKISSVKLFELFTCNFRLIQKDGEELPF